jgi:hypothetical protein
MPDRETVGGEVVFKSSRRSCFKRVMSFIKAGSLGEGNEVTGDLSVAKANVGETAIIRLRSGEMVVVAVL